MSNYDDLPRIASVIDAYTAVLNKGFEDGVEIGQRFLVFGLGDEIFDPVSNKSLGRLELVRGRAKVEHLQTNISTLRCTDTYQRDSGRKMIRRHGSFAMVMGNEEIIENPSTEPKEFDGIAPGDFARKI